MLINSYILAPVGGGGYSFIDSDASAFYTATGIADDTIAEAIDNLTLDLKAASIWSKFSAIWPFVGGTAFTHKWNLKDPRDLDVAHRLTFSGSMTHTSTGAAGDGSTGYADTNYSIGAVIGGARDSHLSYYSRTNGTGGSDISVTLDANIHTNQFFISLAAVGGNYLADTYADNRINVAIPDSLGLFTDSREQPSSDHNGYRNATLLGTGSGNVRSASSINIPFYIFARNNGTLPGPDLFSSRECAFASLGTGLLGTEVSDLYTAVQAFQTALGRDV